MQARLPFTLAAVLLTAGCLGTSIENPDVSTEQDGLVLEAFTDRDEIEVGQAVTVRAELVNQGAGAPEVRDGCASAVELELVTDEGDPVERTPAVGHCQAYSKSRLWPGESVTGALHWNGTVYGNDTYEPAPAGNYTVRVSVETVGEPGQRTQLGPIEVPLVVVADE